MRQTLSLFLLIAGFVIGFTGYCAAVIDWVQDVTTGVYGRNHREALLESAAIGLYSYAAIRFLRSRLPLL